MKNHREKILSIIFFLFLALPLSAQIVIKDSVVITPKRYFLKSLLTQGELKYAVSFSCALANLPAATTVIVTDVMGNPFTMVSYPCPSGPAGASFGIHDLGIGSIGSGGITATNCSLTPFVVDIQGLVYSQDSNHVYRNVNLILESGTRLLGTFTYTLIPPPKPIATIYTESSSPADMDGKFTITPSNTPTITHTADVQCDTNYLYPNAEPSVTWSGPTTINTADYYDIETGTLFIPAGVGSYAQFTNGLRNELKITTSVTAYNDYGSSQATASVYLKANASILLGESQYIYRSLVQLVPPFFEFVYNVTSNPDSAPGRLSGTVFLDPVTTSGSEKNPLYWEYKRPDGTPLPDGIIRIIGRYWEEGKIFTATLKTQGINDSIHIVVIKPSKLLKPGQSPTYKLSKDVFDTVIDIDSICIYYGGKYGVPPQFLKGQMLKEAGKINLGGNEKGFAPSYRYEPFSIFGQFSSAWVESKYKLWVVDPTRTGHEMGTGKGVPVHENVCDMLYPTSPKTVWDILWDHSELVNVGSEIGHKIYGSRNSEGIFYFPKEYESMNMLFSSFLFSSLFEAHVHPSSTPYYETARLHLIRYLRDAWYGGTKQMTAQTRLASSYGLLQMMYGTAVWRLKYPSRDPSIGPEDMNITTTGMYYSLEHMKEILIKKLSSSVEEKGNWPKGFEFYFKEYVWREWNAESTYPNTVYSYSQKFLPQDK